MAHLEKYKASSVGHMLAHYRRDPSSLGRENIDPARVEMDYTLAMDSADESVSSWKRSEKRLDGLGWQLRTSPEGSGREVRG